MDENQKRFFDHEPVTPAWVGRLQGTDAIPDETHSAHPVDSAQRPAYEAPKPLAKDNWLIRSGHLLSYVGLFLFTVAVYLRPHELIEALSPLRTMAFWMALFTTLVFLPTQLSIEGNLTARPREVNLVLLLGLLALLSIPFGDDPATSLDSFGDFIKVILIFVVMVNVLRTSARWHGLLLLLVGTACYVSVTAIASYDTGQTMVEGYRAAGVGTNMFQNPNDMALFLVTIIPILIAMALGTRNLFMKAVYAGCTGLLLGAVLVSYSRGGFMGLMAGIGLMAWKIFRRQRIGALALVIVITLPLVALAPSGFGSRLASSTTITEIGSSPGARWDELKRSLLVTLRHPLLGIGLNNYRYRSNRAQATHNAYTQVSAELGIPALIVYIMFIVAPFKRLRRIELEASALKSEARFRYLSIGLQGGLLAFIVGSFFASVAFLWHIYYLVGLSLCLTRLCDIRKKRGPNEVRDSG